MRNYIITIIIIILDQVSKKLIVNNLQYQETIPVIGDFFQITYHLNTGAAFSILEGKRWFFLITTSIIILGIIWYMNKMTKENKKLLPFAFGLVLGGALGNFIDRAYYGHVVDFLKLYFDVFQYTYPIFNLADTAIVIGACLILLDTIIDWRREKRGYVQ